MNFIKHVKAGLIILAGYLIKTEFEYALEAIAVIYAYVVMTNAKKLGEPYTNVASIRDQKERNKVSAWF